MGAPWQALPSLQSTLLDYEKVRGFPPGKASTADSGKQQDGALRVKSYAMPGHPVMKGVVFDLQSVGLVPGESVEGLHSGFSSVAHLIL